jgi:hypothetical protein
LPGAPATSPNWSSAGTGVKAGTTEFDVAILTFSFTPDAGVTKIFVQNVFGSEEYNEYVKSGFSDNFTMMLNGGGYTNKNLAVIPGTAITVDIDNINLSTNPTWYRDNTVASPPVGDILLDGFTKVLNSTVTVVPGTTYTMSIRIADVADAAYDSAVFIGQFGAALQLDLDGDDSSGQAGKDYKTTFVEGGAAVAIADTDRVITNLDVTSIQ